MTVLRLGRFVLLALILVSGFVAGLVVTGRMRGANESAAQPAAPARPAQEAARLATPVTTTTLPDFADIAARTIPAVTNIASLQVVQAPVSPFANDPFFNFFFRDDPQMFGYRERRGTSAGSGVIVTSSGYVLTNNHVVGDHMRQISVTLADRREREAKLVGTDPLTDIAVLKIDGEAFPTMPWGDSTKLRVGEWVLAIGNPYEMSQTVTLGIVSALGRATADTPLVDFIQTDAAINPGNSGGALINRRGELVGINTAIVSQSGGYQGIGLAVPSNLARRVLDDIVKYGSVRRGSIGALRTVNVTDNLAQELRLKDTRGAIIWEISRASAAYEAGLRPGDVIVSFDGKAVDDAAGFVRLLSDAALGSTVTVQIVRNGRAVDIRVRVSGAQVPRAGI
ncbi:MAG: trypsin-like peptidase domain-containing protein [Vicinamibacterales bacterium]